MPLVTYADVSITLTISRLSVLDDDYAAALKYAQERLGPLPPGVRIETIEVKRT